MMKGLMGRCLKNEAALERVRSKAEPTSKLESNYGEKV